VGAKANLLAPKSAAAGDLMETARARSALVVVRDESGFGVLANTTPEPDPKSERLAATGADLRA